jgi:phage gpG-like protein
MDAVWHEAEILKRVKQVCRVRLRLSGEALQKAISKNITTMELVKTGNLRDSIYLQEMPEELTVRVGTNVPYAGIHEFGGIIKQTVTEKQRRFFIVKGIETQKGNRKKGKKA